MTFMLTGCGGVFGRGAIILCSRPKRWRGHNRTGHDIRIDQGTGHRQSETGNGSQTCLRGPKPEQYLVNHTRADAF